MNDFNIVNLTPENFAEYGVCGYKDVAKHKELKAKLDWFTEYYPKGFGLVIRISCWMIDHILKYQEPKQECKPEFGRRNMDTDHSMI